jgi:hypothetical protein
MRRLIAGDRQRTDGGAVDATESAAVLVAAATAQQLDSLSERRVWRRLRKAIRAQTRYRDADAHVDRFRESSAAKTYLYNEAAEIRRAGSNADKDIDTTTPYISVAVVTLVEIVLLTAEFIFYYSIFTRPLQADAPLFIRLFMGALAILVPCVALLSARLFAGSVHRWHDYRNGEGDTGNLSKRARILGTAAATLLLLAVIIATAWLVTWRYNKDAEASFGVAFVPPPYAMAIVFVSLILADTATRAWLMSPTKHTSIRRRAQTRRTRMMDSWLFRRQSRALSRWIEKDMSLRLLVARLCNDRDQAVATAAAVIQIHRGDKGMPPLKPSGDFGATIDEPSRRTPAARGQSAQQMDDRPLNGHGDGSQLVTPIYSPSHQLEDGDTKWRFRHNVLEQAITYLANNAPPCHPAQPTQSGDDDLLRALDGDPKNRRQTDVDTWITPTGQNVVDPTNPDRRPTEQRDYSLSSTTEPGNK